MVKLKIRKYAYFHIFSLTTFQSWKLMLKADLKWECPYYYSIFLERFSQLKKSKNNGFPIVFSKSDLAMAELYFSWFFLLLKMQNPSKYTLVSDFGGSKTWFSLLCIITPLSSYWLSPSWLKKFICVSWLVCIEVKTSLFV